MCFTFTLCHFCLSLVFFQPRVRVCCRQEEAQEEHRRERDGGREGEVRQEGKQGQAVDGAPAQAQGVGRHGWSAVRGADGAKGNVD